MNTYMAFCLKSFSANMAYRAEVWIRTLGNFVTVIIQAAIWKAVIGEGEINSINLEQMITYSIINTLILALLLTNISHKVNGSLKSGGIASELVRPLSYLMYLFAEGMGGVVYRFVFVVTPSLIISVIFFGIQAPASIAHLFAFLVAMVFALVMSFLLGYLVSLIAFWFLTHFALDWMLGGLMIIFSGSFLPIWFFPDKWAFVAHVLPFQFLGYVPAALYMGYIPKEEIVMNLLPGLIWIGGFMILVQLLWWRAIRRLVVQGG